MTLWLNKSNGLMYELIQFINFNGWKAFIQLYLEKQPSEEKLRAEHAQHSCYSGVTEKDNRVETKFKIFK